MLMQRWEERIKDAGGRKTRTSARKRRHGPVDTIKDVVAGSSSW